MPVLPKGQDLYISQPLTNLSIAYQQRVPYIADQIFPVVPTQKQGGKFFKYRRGDWHRTIAGLRAPATETPGGGWTVEQDDYFCDTYGVHKDVDDQTKANADSMFNLDRDATEFVTQQLLLKRDQLWMESYFQPGLWNGGLDNTGATLAPGTNFVGVNGAPVAPTDFTKFSDAAATPIEFLRRQITGAGRLTGYKPNVCVMTPEVMDTLLDHPTLIERIKYSQQGILNEALIASMLNLPKVVVAETVHNVAPFSIEQDNIDMQRLAGNHLALFHVAPRASTMTPSAGYTFTWSGYLGSQAFGTTVRRFRMEAIRSDRVEGEMSFGSKQVASELGIFLEDVI